MAVACCFDNEEIGSATKQGAGSSFLQAVLETLNEALGFTRADFHKAREKGMILSIDNAHTVHPAHPEKSDPINKVRMGEGVVIKHHQNYSTDGFFSALLKNLLSKNDVKFQDFYCNSDLSCGSTLGLISSCQLHMNALDVGISQLAMHSAIEMLNPADIQELEKCCKLFFECSFNCEN